MPYNALDRTTRGQLQRVAGDSGEILERVTQTTRARPYVGWWWRPLELERGCSGRHCAAARAEQPEFLGYHLRDAMRELVHHADAHPALVAA